MITNTPKPPYYAVIFTSTLSNENAGYTEMAEKMLDLATKQSGFLGVEGARDSIGITVSYWDSLDAIADWKANSEHLLAQKLGKSTWYESFTTRIAKVERDYCFSKTVDKPEISQ